MSYYNAIIARSGTRGLVAAGLMGMCLVSFGVYAASDSEKNCDGPSHHTYHSHHSGDDFKHHDGGGRDWSRSEHPRHARFLELTDAQKQSLKDLRSAQEPAQQALQEKIQVARDALHNAGESNANDETLNRLALELAKLQSQKEVARIKTHQQFVSILTPEQKQKLSEQKDKRGDRGSHKEIDKK